MKKMKKRVKALWLKALRSGEFKQARRQLKRGNGYCCLGVLTELYLREQRERIIREIKFGGSPADLLQDIHIPDAEDATLDDAVQAWAGLNNDDPYVFHKKGEDTKTLSALNDDERLTFKQIASCIQKSL